MDNTKEYINVDTDSLGGVGRIGVGEKEDG